MSSDAGALPRLVLASSSRTRRELLERAGVAFEVVPSVVDEREVEAPLLVAGVTPLALAAALAAAKALEVSRRAQEALVIGADQVLDLDGQRLTKPGSRGEARTHLRALRGRMHALHSAVVLARGGAVTWQATETAHLAMRAFSDTFLDDYLDRVGPAVTTSVGAYQVEGLGIQLFERIEGATDTILGLPLLPLLAALRREGVVAA